MVSGRGSDEARRRANEALAARRRAAGWKNVNLWLPPEVVAAVNRVASHRGKSFNITIIDLLPHE